LVFQRGGGAGWRGSACWRSSALSPAVFWHAVVVAEGGLQRSRQSRHHGGQLHSYRDGHFRRPYPNRNGLYHSAIAPFEVWLPVLLHHPHARRKHKERQKFEFRACNCLTGSYSSSNSPRHWMKAALRAVFPAKARCFAASPGCRQAAPHPAAVPAQAPRRSPGWAGSVATARRHPSSPTPSPRRRARTPRPPSPRSTSGHQPQQHESPLLTRGHRGSSGEGATGAEPTPK
jgi:hypothetical protein